MDASVVGHDHYVVSQAFDHFRPDPATVPAADRESIPVKDRAKLGDYLADAT